MKKGSFSKLFVLLLVVGLLFAVAPTRQAQAQTTITVCASGCDYTTIQAAIDAASAGDTINVAAGTYVEMVTFNKPLTLLGPNQGIDGTTGTRVGEAILKYPDGDNSTWSLIDAVANNITIDGFTFINDQVDNFGVSGGWEVILVGENITFVNNRVISQAQRKIPFKIQGPFTGAYDPNNHYGGAVVKYNYIESRNTSWSTVILQGIGGTVQYNTIAGAASGIQIQPYSNTVGGDVSFNNISSYFITIWHNYHVGGVGTWVYDSNNITSYNEPTANMYTPLTHPWYGMRVETHKPNIEVKNNIFDGDGPRDYSPLRTIIGLRYWNNLEAGSQINVHDNEIKNVMVNVENQSAVSFDLDAVFSNNTFEKSVLIEGGKTIFTGIQEAIDAAADGDTILVGPGTYNEAINLNKPNITVKSTDGAAATIISPPLGTLTTGVQIHKNMGVVTFEGFTVQNFTESGIIQSMGNREGTTAHVRNNIVRPAGDYLRNGIQVTGDGSTVIGNEVYGARLTTDWGSSGILVVHASNVVVSGNTIIAPPQGMDIGISVLDWDLASGLTNITITNNTIVGADYPIDINSRGGPISNIVANYNKITGYDGGMAVWAGGAGGVTGVDTSKNWWGSINGPATGSISDNITFAPWCGDEACSFLVNMVEPGEGLQAAIDRTPVGGTLFVPDINDDDTPDYTDASDNYGYKLNGQHLILADGVIIRNSGGCFEILGDHTWIRTESPAGAKCIPTNGHAGVLGLYYEIDDFVVDGLEFDGTGENSGAGIYLNAGGSNIMILNNYMHDLYSNNDPNYPSGAFEYYSTISGEFYIQGNLFKDTAGIVDLGNWDTPAEYNSWGAYTVTQEMVDYIYKDYPPDGKLVNYEPYTHAEIVLKSTNPTGDNLLNYVFADESITYEVYGVFKEVFGGEFTLTYDPAVLKVEELTPGTSPFVAVGQAALVVDDGAGKLRFQGSNGSFAPYSSANENGTLLFSVTFKPLVDAKTTTKLTIDPETDVFSFIVTDWSIDYYTTHIYGILPEDVTVTVIDHPVISSENITDYFLVDEEKQFEVSLANPATGEAYTDIMFKITIPNAKLADINSAKFYETGWPLPAAWYDLALVEIGDDLVGWYGGTFYGGFPMPAPQAATPGSLMVNFKEAGEYTINLELFTMTGTDLGTPYNYSGEAIRLIAEETFIMKAYDEATVSVVDEVYYLVGDPGVSTITITNPSTGYPYGNTIVFDFTIFDHVLADITSATCSYGPIVLDVKALFTETNGDLVARLGGADGYFTVNAPSSTDITCTTTFATDGVYETKAEMVHVVGPEERIVASFEGTTVVYTKPVISTDIVGPYQQGVEYPVVISVDNVDQDFTPNDYNLSLVLPADATVVYGPGVDDYVICTAGTACIIPVTLADVDNEVELTITFTGAGEGPVSVSLIDPTVDPGKVLATYTTAPTEVAVIANVASVTGTISMQGRTVRAGVPVTLTGPSGFAFGPYTAYSTEVIGTNLFFTNLPSSIYTITTNQPRYLNLTLTDGKTIDISSQTVIAHLRLLAGNAVWTDNNKIDFLDAGLIGTDWGKTFSSSFMGNCGDVNFDGIVSINDLALVGGNMDLGELTSAYASWMP